jgi:MerR HTH family regulatory protein
MGEIAEEERIYISQLSEIVNREANTIRKWERLGLLPKRLLPRRGYRGWRYWTHEQVHGVNGILAWMDENDMRPGRYITSPEDSDKHVAALRHPKYMTKRLVRHVRTLTRKRTPLEEILDEIFPHTKYASKANLEYALRRYFNRQGWVFPPYDDNSRPGL